MNNQLETLELTLKEVEGDVEYFTTIFKEEYSYLWEELFFMADYLKRLQALVQAFEKYRKTLNKAVEHIRTVLIPTKMEEEGITKVSFEGIGNVRITNDLRARILPMQNEAAFEWLRDNGLGDIVKETVNASTLKAVAKERLKADGEILPSEMFDIYPFQRASITNI